MESGEIPFRQRALELLRAGPFRRYILGSAVSDTGTWMQVMAQAWVVSSLTDRALLLGMVNFAAGIPTLALTMIGGSAADRYDKRKILIIAQIVQSILAAILGTLVLTGVIQVWHVIVLAACLGVCIAFEMPAISALVPELVRREQISTAIALDRSVFHGSRLVGPSVAGMLVAWIGAAAAFYANAVSFFALMIAMLSLPARKIGTAEEEEQRRSGFQEGLRYVRSDRTILCMIGLIALTTVFVFPFLSVMLPLYVRNILHLGADRMGLLMAVSGTGSLAGSLGLLSVAPRHRFQFMTVAAMVAAVALFCMSRSANFMLAAVSMVILAVCLSLNFGLAGTIVQERAPAHLRGRVSAVFGLSFFGLMPIAGLLTTELSDLIGMQTALMISSICFGAGALVVMNFAGRTRPGEPASTEPLPEPAVTASVTAR
ncbi:MAG TPA: MFS transporter [Chthoniobacterales bacterium]|nr:MFS transporter [Chthoniobacterales bacterium]